MSLKTNYKDDILSEEGNLRHYRQIANSDSTVSFEDTSQYITVGDNFGADDINATNTQVNANTSSISSINSKITSINGNLTSVNSDIETINNNLNELGRKLLWENPSPNSPMNATTISVDFSGYDLFFIEYLDAYAEGNAKHTVPFMKDGGMFALQTFDLVDKWRTFTPNVSDNTMSITIGRKQGQYGTTSSNADDNTCLIPTRIFGFK